MRDVVVSSDGFLKQQVAAGNHSFVADEPVEAGGGDLGPDPYSLLLAALGACTSMTLQIYARHKGIPLEGVRVRLRHNRLHATDCSECESTEGMVSRIERHISLTGQLTDAQKQRLMEIAARCPVNKTLTSEIVVADFLDGPAGV